jgi:hypothetical protein
MERAPGVFMRIRLAAALAASLLLAAGPAAALDAEFVAPLTALAEGPLADIAAEPALVEAIMAQNAVTGAYDQTQIDALDAQWRAEVDGASRPLIAAVLASAASRRLAQLEEASAGQYTEIFATDARGLNVAQSAITSDYWQGDEDKFTETFPRGAGAVFLGEVEEDESTQTFQSQVSLTIVDPATGTPIGTLTVGVDLATL